MGYYGRLGAIDTRSTVIAPTTSVRPRAPLAPAPVVGPIYPVVYSGPITNIPAPTAAVVPATATPVPTVLGAIGVIGGAALAVYGVLTGRPVAIVVGVGAAVAGGVAVFVGMAPAPATVVGITPAIAVPAALQPRLYGQQQVPQQQPRPQLGQATLGQASLDISLPWWVVLPIILTPLAVLGLGTYLLLRKPKAA